jgi:hypothetical protein
MSRGLISSTGRNKGRKEGRKEGREGMTNGRKVPPKCLALPPTSVQSQILLAITNVEYSDHKSKLTVVIAKKLVFLHHNVKLSHFYS